MTIQEIEARKAEINSMMEDPGADLDALLQEVNQLNEERAQIEATIEERKSKLAAIAAGTAKVEDVQTIEENKEERTMNVRETVEYRNAFMKHLMGVELNTEERAALTSASASAGAALPIETANEIERRLVQIAPILGEVTMFHVPGNLTVAVESATTTDGVAHGEGALATENADVLVPVMLGGFEVIKLLSISGKVKAMSIPAFENWLIDNITDGIAYKLEDYIINGTGSNEPTGIDTVATKVVTATAPTYANVCTLIAALPGVFDHNAKLLMNKKTLWGEIMPIRDDGKAPIVRGEGSGEFHIMGYQVLVSDKVADGTIYFGDFKTVYANLAEDVNVEKSEQSSFRSNLVDYRGTAVFDCKPTNSAAFVALKNA